MLILMKSKPVLARYILVLRPIRAYIPLAKKQRSKK